MTSQSNASPKIPNPLRDMQPTADAARQSSAQPDTSSYAELDRRIAALEQKRVNLNTDVFGMFEVVSAAPSGTPKDLYDQVKIYTNGSTHRLYWYDTVNHAWRYASGT